MAGSDRRKQNLYFPESALDEIRSEAARLNRSMSWVIQKSWKFARLQVIAIPSANEPEVPPAIAAGDSQEPKEG